MAKENLQRTGATRGKSFDQLHIRENMQTAPHLGKHVTVVKRGKNQPVSLAEKYEPISKSVKFFVSQLPSHNWD